MEMCIRRAGVFVSMVASIPIEIRHGKDEGVSGDIQQTIQDCLSQGKQPDHEHIALLLQHVQAAETMIAVLSQALADMELERDAYMKLTHRRSEVLEQLHQATSYQTHQPDGIQLSDYQHNSPYQRLGWRYNLREFFEMNSDGWRAIVSSDSEEFLWVAYIERNGVRYYATQKFPQIQDALTWCIQEIEHQAFIDSE